MELNNFRTCNDLQFTLNNCSRNYFLRSLFLIILACCLNTSVIKPQHVAVCDPLRSIGFYLRKEQSEWKNTLKATRMSNFVHIETFMLKLYQLVDDRELVFEKKRPYHMIFIGFSILASIKLTKRKTCIQDLL